MKNILSLEELFEENFDIFEKVKTLLTNKKFPCLFAINSYYKKQMFFCKIPMCMTSDELYKYIYSVLKEFRNFVEKEIKLYDKSFFTILFIIDNNFSLSSRDQIKDFIFNLLIGLKALDNTEECITEEDILKYNFEFSLDDFVWFPVFMGQEHISLIRKSPVSVIAFQPKITFECLKKVKNDFILRQD